MRCSRRIVTNGAYRRFRRFVRWFKNSGAGARCVTNNKRKMGGQKFGWTDDTLKEDLFDVYYTDGDPDLIIEFRGLTELF